MRDTSLLSDLINAFKAPERSISEFPTKARAKLIKDNHNLSHNGIRMPKVIASDIGRSLSKTKLLILDDDIVKKAVDIFFDGDTDFREFYKYAVVPYSNCFIEWNEKLRMDETLRQYMVMQKLFKDNFSRIAKGGFVHPQWKELFKSVKDFSTQAKGLLGKTVENAHDSIINDQMNKVNMFYRTHDITGDIKVGFHVKEFYLRDYIGFYEEFPSKFQKDIDHKLHDFVPYVLGTDLDGKKKVFCNFNSMMFDPDIKVANIFHECILEQFMVTKEKDQDFFDTIENFKDEFKDYSISFFGSSFMSTEKFLQDRVFFNWQNNRGLFQTDYECYRFYERKKVSLPDEFNNEYIPFKPFNMGAFLLICLGLLNHQKTEYIDVPSRDQKRSMSFGNQTPRKEYHLVKFGISDNPKKIVRTIAKKINKVRKLVKLHERKQHFRKFKTINGEKISLPREQWIRVRSAWVGNKKHGEIHKDWHIVKDS